jgi:threonine dehydrogenase-like Zn-dependent dehydrogenase
LSETISMQAAVWNADGALDVVERPVPEPRPGWVRIRTVSAGICGTDLQFSRGGFPPPVGLVPGHEIGGLVDAVGDDVALSLGTPIAVEPLLGCGACVHCATGHENRCAQRTVFGLTSRGGMAQFMTVPASRAWCLPVGLDADDGALVEPLAVCTRGLRLGDVRLGDRVCVIGAGTVGLLSIVVAQAAGAAEVRFAARYPAQRERALALGGLPTDSEEFDVVVETVGGHSHALAEAVERARPGGTVVMLGIYDSPTPLPAYELSLKELRVVGSNCYAHVDGRRDFAVALDLLVDRCDDLRTLVTHEYRLEDVNDAFATAADKSTGSVKVTVRP